MEFECPVCIRIFDLDCPNNLLGGYWSCPTIKMSNKGLGFDFSLYSRNSKLISKTGENPHLKTGTTIAAITYNGGVVLGADTRATAGPVVAVKDVFKIHYISENIW